LGHQAEVDANIRQGEEDLRRLVPPLSQRRPEDYLLKSDRWQCFD